MDGRGNEIGTASRVRAEAIVAEHLAGLREGEKPDIGALCARHPEIAEEIRSAHEGGPGTRPLRPPAPATPRQAPGGAEEADLGISLDEPPKKPGDTPSGHLIERLRAHTPKESRYELRGEVARGGMGAIVKVWDSDLRRTLAMKVVLGKEPAPTGGGTPTVEVQTLGRFLEEAQLTGQLDHPGIVPVHELGLDAEGRVYFTMRLVKGRDFREILDLVRGGKEGWSQTRALGVLLKACEAMAYAHAKGVIHRDLKPANVMVGRFGEVYVMDWGLARVMGREDRKDIRIRSEDGPASERIRTVRAEEAESTPGSPLLTVDGDVIGTPAYMPPEQARNEVDQVGPRSDVYSLGAMLYHLLTGEMPFVRADEKVPPLLVLARVLAGPPRPVQEGSPGVPAELDAICEKAMARKPAHRYADMVDLAEDLRAYLEGRVVRAHRTGALVELKKWVVRNRGWAATIGIALVLLIGASATTTLVVSGKNKQVSAARTEAVRALLKARWQAYVAGITTADRSMEEGNAAEARRQLDTCPGEHRGWEWYHLDLKQDTSLKVLRGHRGDVRAVAFSPDGRRIVSGGGDQTVRIWDAETGELLSTLNGHQGKVYSVAFSPDGKRIASGSWDRTMRIWDAETGKEIVTARGHDEGVVSVAFSPDGKRIVSGSWDETARIWQSDDGRLLTTLRGHDAGIVSAIFSPDGKRVATGSWDKTARVWDVETGKRLVTLSGSDARVSFLAFASDGKRIFSGFQDDTVRVWDLESGLLVATLSGHLVNGTAAAFSGDGRKGASGSKDGTVHLWAADDGRPLAVLGGHTDAVASLAFSPDGRRIVSGSDDRTLRVWDAVSADVTTKLRGHQGKVYSVAFSPDGERIASGSWDKTARIWDAMSGELLTVLRGHEDEVYSVAFSPDGARVVSGSWDRIVRIWDAKTGDLLSSLRGHEDAVHCVTFSPDGKRVASGSWDKTVRIWSAETGDLLSTLRGHEDAVQSVAFSPEGKTIASGGEDRTVRIWNVQTGALLLTLSGHEDSVQSVVFSRDGRLVTSGSWDRTIRIWEVATGELRATFPRHKEGVLALALSPDGSRIASAPFDSTIRVWTADEGELLMTLALHDSPAWALAFSPDGRRLASGCGDGTVRIWESELATAKKMWHAAAARREGNVAAPGVRAPPNQPASTSQQGTR